MMQTTNQIALKNFVSVEELTNLEIMSLILRASEFKNGVQPDRNLTAGTYASNLFFENSTRTHKSFEMAEHKLGMQVINFDTSTSSISKGETLYDTVLTLSAIGVDVVVIRHSAEAYYTELIESPGITASIVNGGDGAGQHPSQCLLDLLTIYEEFHTFSGVKVAICGDLSHSRVAKTNMQMLQRLGATVYFTGPKEWYDPTFDQYGTHMEIDDIIGEVDVMMLLRVQTERHGGKAMRYTKAEYLDQFGLTVAREARMKEAAIIMHPAPVNRDVELADSLVECRRSRIVTQMKNGVFARMAILEAIMNGRTTNV